MKLKPNFLAVISTTTMMMAKTPKATNPSGVEKPARPDPCPEGFIYALPSNSTAQLRAAEDAG
jgi:hypothetical protein